MTASSILIRKCFSKLCRGKQKFCERMQKIFSNWTVHKNVSLYNTSADGDDFFQYLVKSQSQRLDDQRVTLSSLPGMEAFTMRDPKDRNALKTNFDQFCNMVSRAHVSFPVNFGGHLISKTKFIWSMFYKKIRFTISNSICHFLVIVKFTSNFWIFSIYIRNLVAFYFIALFCILIIVNNNYFQQVLALNLPINLTLTHVLILPSNIL